jgi:tRNA U38,U39,U40 pseudouridine synthase TruA
MQSTRHINIVKSETVFSKLSNTTKRSKNAFEVNLKCSFRDISLALVKYSGLHSFHLFIVHKNNTKRLCKILLQTLITKHIIYFTKKQKYPFY